MDNHDEQLEELKAWWSEYGRSVLVGVVLAIVTVGGWNFWTSYQKQQAEEASNVFYEMMDAYAELEQSMISMSGNPKAQNEDKLVKLGKFKQSVDSLTKQYAGTEYAHYANLQLAKYHALEGNLGEAEKALRDVLADGPNNNIELLTKLRLARVIAAQEKYDEALALVNNESSQSYESAFLEVKGDILYQQGKMSEALEAYTAARDASQEPSIDLDMKYYNLLGR